MQFAQFCPFAIHIHKIQIPCNKINVVIYHSGRMISVVRVGGADHGLTKTECVCVCWFCICLYDIGMEKIFIFGFSPTETIEIPNIYVQSN